MAPARPLVCCSLIAALLVALLPSTALRADDAPAGPSEKERAEIQKMVDGLREEASRIRGLAWKTVVPADLVTRPQMRADFMAEIDKEYPPEKRDRDVAILRRTGLLGADQDLIALFMDFMESGVAGYYDPKKKHLRIVEGLAGPEQQPTILHELIHALEDQYYDLESRTKPIEDDGDRLFAEKCIVEGSAEHARALYEKAHPELAEVFLKAQQNPTAAAAQMKAFAKVPAWMFITTLLHYTKGPAFVGRFIKGGTYPERIHALYAAPPVSQEQLLHPARWFGEKQDYPTAVACASDLAKTAGEGWSLLHALPQGELDLALLLDFFLGPTRGKYNVLTGQTPYAAANSGARGWDAGQMWVLKKEGTPLVIVEAWAFDTDADAWEAGEMLGKAAQKAAGEAWKSAGWAKAGAGTADATSTLDYVNQHGASRMLVRGSHVLRVDGATADVLEALWPAVLKTRFTKDPRDTWDPASEGAALAAAGFVDAKQGVGLTAPSAAWKVTAGGSNPRAIATLVDPERRLEVVVSVVGREMPVVMVALAAAPEVQKRFPDYDGEPTRELAVGEHEGVLLPLGTDKDGIYGELVLASGAGRFFSLTITGPSKEALDAAREELDALLASIVARE